MEYCSSLLLPLDNIMHHKTCIVCNCYYYYYYYIIIIIIITIIIIVVIFIVIINIIIIIIIVIFIIISIIILYTFDKQPSNTCIIRLGPRRLLLSLISHYN